MSSLFDDYTINPDKVPTHIAVVMDGNGRWAKKRFLPRTAGHKAGRTTLKKMLKSCAKLGVKHLSAYTFSTENWSRPKDEVSFLMTFFKKVLSEEVKELHAENVRLKFLGELSALDEDIIRGIQDAETLTENNSKIQLNVMLNYGSRTEIIRAIQRLTPDEISHLTEDQFSQKLYTQDIPDPDILIRTSGEYRISNFLLWQLAYSEFFFTDCLWPDFSEADLCHIIKQFQDRDRRHGGINT